MANTVISPNMFMPVPVVGTDPGPDWATNINASLSIIDSHNHTTGQGVPITPQGININTDLPMNGNNLITARSVRFSPQSGTIVGASDLGCLYENGVDLYYIDGAGNQVRITQGGSVTGATGTITGLPSGTASAAFAGSTFTFQSATNTPATLNVGTVVLGQTVASGKNVTIAASGSQASNYNLTLPIALPAAQSAVISDASGNLGFIGIQNTTYTPTITAIQGGTSFSVSGPMMVSQVGTMVYVSGVILFTSTGGLTQCTITLPIVRTDGNFNHSYEGVGSAVNLNSTPIVQSGQVVADTGGNQLVNVFIGAPSPSNTTGVMYVQFSYSLVNF